MYFFWFIVVGVCLNLSSVMSSDIKFSKGDKEVEIKSTVSYLFENPSRVYSPLFSPPKKRAQDGSSLQPTIVHVSLTNFRGLTFDLQSYTHIFGFDIVEEYVDLRLTYGNSTGLKYIDVNAQGGHQVWSPSISFPVASLFDIRKSNLVLSDDYTYSPKVLVGPEGHVYRKFGVYLQLRAPLIGFDVKETNYMLRLVEEMHPTEDVKLQWKDGTDPVTPIYSEYLPEAGSSGVLYLRVNSTSSNCTQVENLGPLGSREFSCLQLDFTLTRRLW